MPANYDSLYKSYAAQGARVIALASRALPEAETDPVATLKAMSREALESDMVWEGFAIFQVRGHKGSTGHVTPGRHDGLRDPCDPCRIYSA